MRKPRVIIFDDEPSILEMLKDFFSKMGYEVLCFNNPTVCPIFEKDKNCVKEAPCADIFLTDFNMPKMNGIEWFKYQNQRGCQLDIKNKAVITGETDKKVEILIEQLGCAFFKKPIQLSELSKWIKECEKEMDLSEPLDII